MRRGFCFPTETDPVPSDVFAKLTFEAASPADRQTEIVKGDSMLYTIAVVLLILWLLGLVTSYTLGGLIHVFLVIAIIMILFNLLSGRRTL